MSNVKAEILENVQTGHLLFDGAMGTQLQARGLPVGEQSEYFNLSHPEVVQAIHAEYVAAGADVITTNTFQTNRRKLPAAEVAPIIAKAIELAQAAHPKYVAYDMGPIGELMAPMGTLSFNEAYDVFAEQAIAAAEHGADLILIETMADLLETKAAVLAVKENTTLPVFATLTYQADGRTFVGTDPQTATLTIQALGVDAIGLNCSLGPEQLLPLVDDILQYATVPVMVQPNAGLPDIEDGQTVYHLTAAEFTKYLKIMVAHGVSIIGSCCGSTPEFTRSLRAVLNTQAKVTPQVKRHTAVTSSLQTVILDDGVHVIGERINPTGKKKLKAALREQDLGYIIKEAIAQKDAGADILDVNVGLPELDEPKTLLQVSQELQNIVPLPLQLDSADPVALAAAARQYNGLPLINSVNGKAESLAEILPIAKKYGGVILGLALDEDGIPDTAAGRLAIAKRIVETAGEYGIPKESVMIDPLVLTASAQQAQVQVTLDTIKLVTAQLGVKTVIGLSNVSFGLPNRELLNSTFLAAAVGAGLAAPIMNPLAKGTMNTLAALKVFKNQDTNSANYIEQAQQGKFTVTAGSPVGQAPTDKAGATTAQTAEGPLDLKQMIIAGRKELTAAETKRQLAELTPLEVVNQFFVPALDVVGTQFEKGELFLPQLMQSAEAVKNAQVVLKKALLQGDAPAQVAPEKILLATVAGDIHDIGKNIVRMVLENYGYQIIDLGKDVPIATVVATVREQNIKLVGLSALMTTTVRNMQATISAVRAAGLDAKFMVGGAVLNEEYTTFVGADYYAPDAMASVKIAQAFFK